MNHKRVFSFFMRGCLLIGLLIATGCVWVEENPGDIDLGVSPKLGTFANSAAYKDTIGAYTYYEGLRSMRVRGYGLVVGLGKNGSRNCPRNVFDHLVETLYKKHPSAMRIVGEQVVSPEKLIRDIDTAVVMVQGDIPAAAVEGTRFDVAVLAIPGTQTVSLRGGTLYSTDLRVFTTVATGVSLTGQVLATASGPTFQNPFSENQAATRSTKLEATLLGGGRAIKDRRIRLVMLEPSYQRARQIQNRINSHFPGTTRTASAMSPSYVQLHIPEEFVDDTAHFLGLVRALYLSSDPRTNALRARTLAKEWQKADAPHGQIALAFEGMGRAALPVLEDLYPHHDHDVSFHAAAAGLRLGDHVASDTMIAHAQDQTCPLRHRAIRALGRTRGMGGATMTLRNLLHDSDPRIRVEAYESLLRRDDSSIRSQAVGVNQFMLDMVSTDEKGFVYATRHGSQRIALFGRNLTLRPPLFYRSSNGSLTLTARENDDHIIALRVVVGTGSTSPPIKAPFALKDLIPLLGNDAEVDIDGKVLGLGLDFTTVVNAIYHLARDGALAEPFILQQPENEGLVRPRKIPQRPESEN